MQAGDECTQTPRFRQYQFQAHSCHNSCVKQNPVRKADQAGNLADMAENLSQKEAAVAMEAIEKVYQKRADDAVRDFRTWFDAALLPILKDFAELAGAKLTIRQDHFHDITAVFTGRCGFDITATQKRMRMAMAAADHISVNRWSGSDEVEFSLIFGFPENEE